MRIIAGKARGRRLATLPGQDVRPTLERVKEGIFSAVQFWLPGAAVLDLYAGSGQLGLEALSRGAARCVFVDSSAAAERLIYKNAESVGFAGESQVVRSDAEAFLARWQDKFDLILMDPPYHEDARPGLLRAAAAVAAPGALMLYESGAAANMPAETAGFVLEKQYRYGTVLVSRYRMAAVNENADAGGF